MAKAIYKIWKLALGQTEWKVFAAPFKSRADAQHELDTGAKPADVANYVVAALKPKAKAKPAPIQPAVTPESMARAKRIEKRAANRAKTKEQTPAERAIERAKPQRAPKKKPAAPANGLTPEDERRNWPNVKRFKLERQARPIREAEALEIIEALGGSQGLMATALSQWARPLHEGTLVVDLSKGGKKVDGHTATLIDIVAVGKDTYDVRIVDVGLHLLGKPLDAVKVWASALTDAQYLDGSLLIKTVAGVTKADMLTKLADAGLDLIKPMDPVEVMKVRAAAVKDLFEKCPCPECEAARTKAKANGTDLLSERLAIEPADGGFARLKTDLAPVLDPKIVNTQEDEKLREAMKRSTLLATAEPSGTKH